MKDVLKSPVEQVCMERIAGDLELLNPDNYSQYFAEYNLFLSEREQQIPDDEKKLAELEMFQTAGRVALLLGSLVQHYPVAEATRVYLQLDSIDEDAQFNWWQDFFDAKTKDNFDLAHPIVHFFTSKDRPVASDIDQSTELMLADKTSGARGVRCEKRLAGLFPNLYRDQLLENGNTEKFWYAVVLNYVSTFSDIPALTAENETNKGEIVRQIREGVRAYETFEETANAVQFSTHVKDQRIRGTLMPHSKLIFEAILRLPEEQFKLALNKQEIKGE